MRDAGTFRTRYGNKNADQKIRRQLNIDSVIDRVNLPRDRGHENGIVHPQDQRAVSVRGLSSMP